MANDACHLPPGREWEILHCLPVIPRPQWERFVRTGQFPQGIQKGLDETARCPCIDDMAQVRVPGVVVDGAIQSVTIRGVFPPGWYRYVLPDAPAPPTAADVLEAARQVHVPAGIDFSGGELSLTPLEPQVGLSLDAPPDVQDEVDTPSRGCEVVPVPTVEVTAPYPLVDGYVRTRSGQSWVLAGELGRLVARIPGSDHPMFATGYCIIYICREQLSDFGRDVFDFWDEVRASGRADDRFREVSYVWPWCGLADMASVPILHATRYFQPTHMQCPRNHYPQSELWHQLGVAGEPVAFRWRIGGGQPAPAVAGVLEFYEEHALAEWVQSAGGDVARWSAQPWTMRYPTGVDAQGRAYSSQAPEAPFGFRDDGWHGPPPGSYLPSGGNDSARLDAQLQATPVRGLGGLDGFAHQPQLGGVFDTLRDIVTLKPVRHLVGEISEEAWHLARKQLRFLWGHLPAEVRELTIQLGPYFAGAFGGPWAVQGAKLAVAVLEQDRQARSARKQLKKAVKAGKLPDWFDPNNPQHLLALSRVAELGAQGAEPAASSEAAVVQEPVTTAIEPSVAGGAFTSGAFLALLAL